MQKHLDSYIAIGFLAIVEDERRRKERKREEGEGGEERGEG